MKLNIVKRIAVVLTVSIALLSITNCKQLELEPYSSKSALYIANECPETGATGIDSAFVTFFTAPTATELEVPFVVSLIGNIPESDLEYEIEVIDSLTTALSGEYRIPNKLIFRAGMVHDTLRLIVLKSDRLSTQDVKLSIRIKENENFNLGYFGKLTAGVRYNNIKVMPDWWDDVVVSVYLGEFSFEKYELFLTVVEGANTFDSAEAFEKRTMALEFKEYIEENGNTEADGQPMVIPIY